MDPMWLWNHHAVGKYTDPDNPNFSFGKYFSALRNQENQNKNKIVMAPISPELKSFLQWIASYGGYSYRAAYPAYFTTKQGFQYPGLIATDTIHRKQIY